MSINPWTAASAASVPVPEPEPEVTASPAPAGWLKPSQAGDASHAGVANCVSVGPGRCVMGAHGGAGTTTMANLLGAVDCGRLWPVCSAGTGAAGVLVVARTHMAGIEAARTAAITWSRGQGGNARLLGVIWTPDAPGKLPGDLKQALAMASGAFPASYALPWAPAWRLTATPWQHVPRDVQRALSGLGHER